MPWCPQIHFWRRELIDRLAKKSGEAAFNYAGVRFFTFQLWNICVCEVIFAAILDAELDQPQCKIRILRLDRTKLCVHKAFRPTSSRQLEILNWDFQGFQSALRRSAFFFASHI